MTLLRRYVADLIGAYRDGARVVAGLPWLFAAIILWEFAQHVIEYRIGFYDSRAAAKAVGMDGSRMALGWVKMLLVYVGGFFAIRYLVLGRAAALRPSAATCLRYLPYIAYALVLFALILYAGDWLAPERVMPFRATIGLAQVAIEPLLMPWIVSAATDGAVRNPWQSLRHVGRWYPLALAMFFVGRIPISAAHQLLGTQGIGRPAWQLWPLLALDAIVVGLLIAIIPALYVRIVAAIDAYRARRRVSPSFAPAS